MCYDTDPLETQQHRVSRAVKRALLDRHQARGSLNVSIKDSKVRESFLKKVASQ
jgi:hypothetical protein